MHIGRYHGPSAAPSPPNPHASIRATISPRSNEPLSPWGEQVIMVRPENGNFPDRPGKGPRTILDLIAPALKTDSRRAKTGCRWNLVRNPPDVRRARKEFSLQDSPTTAHRRALYRTKVDAEP